MVHGPRGLDAVRRLGVGVKVVHLARKPLEGSVINNVTCHGTGGVHIERCRVNPDGTRGRFPSNVVMEHDPGCGDVCAETCPIHLLDEEVPVSGAQGQLTQEYSFKDRGIYGKFSFKGGINEFYGERRGASQFFARVRR